MLKIQRIIMFVVLIVAKCIMFASGSYQTSDLPVEKCNLSDKACLKAAIQKMVPIFLAGMPEHGVEVLDPMEMYDMHYDISGLQFSLFAGTYKGLKNAIIEDVNWDMQQEEFTITFHTDNEVTGPYSSSGRVGELPMSGDGNMKVYMKNLYVKLTIHFDIENNYVKPSKFSVEFEVKDHADIYLSNLFNGDKVKSDEMLKFFNDNWKQAFVDFGQPLIDIVARKIYENVSRFFENNSLENIAIV